jgi:hypothetical protein
MVRLIETTWRLIMNVHETNEIRDLTATELDVVAGGLLAQIGKTMVALVDALFEEIYPNFERGRAYVNNDPWDVK